MSERTDRMVRAFHDALPRAARHIVGDLGEFLPPALDAALAESAELTRLRTLTTALVEALPKCLVTDCSNRMTKEPYEICDVCAEDEDDARDLPYAKALRALVAELRGGR